MFSRDELFWRGICAGVHLYLIFVPGMIIIPMVIAVLLDRVENGIMSTFYRIMLADSVDDPGAADLRPLALDVQQLHWADQLHPGRRAAVSIDYAPSRNGWMIPN